MKIIKNITMIGLAFILTSCATIFSGTTQMIRVKVINNEDGEVLQGAFCKFIGENGEYYVEGNPGSAKVPKGQNINIECRKKGFRQINTAVGDSFNVVTAVNVVFWPGFLIDAATGAYKKYPSHYIVSMQKTEK